MNTQNHKQSYKLRQLIKTNQYNLQHIEYTPNQSVKVDGSSSNDVITKVEKTDFYTINHTFTFDDSKIEVYISLIETKVFKNDREIKKKSKTDIAFPSVTLSLSCGNQVESYEFKQLAYVLNKHLQVQYLFLDEDTRSYKDLMQMLNDLIVKNESLIMYFISNYI